MPDIDQIRVDPAFSGVNRSASIYEHGWQSWSPSQWYPLTARPLRPHTENSRVMNWRPDTRAPADAFWGEGLLAVDPGDGSGVVVFAAAPGADPVPSIRADVRGEEVVVSADGPVERIVASDPDPDPDPAVSPGNSPAAARDALGRWGEGYAAALGVVLRPESPTVWCSWYQYFEAVTEESIAENLTAMDDLGLDIDVVQIDVGEDDHSHLIDPAEVARVATARQ